MPSWLARETGEPSESVLASVRLRGAIGGALDRESDGPAQLRQPGPQAAPGRDRPRGGLPVHSPGSLHVLVRVTEDPDVASILCGRPQARPEVVIVQWPSARRS